MREPVPIPPQNRNPCESNIARRQAFHFPWPAWAVAAAPWTFIAWLAFVSATYGYWMLRSLF